MRVSCATCFVRRLMTEAMNSPIHFVLEEGVDIFMTPNITPPSLDRTYCCSTGNARRHIFDA